MDPTVCAARINPVRAAREMARARPLYPCIGPCAVGRKCLVVPRRLRRGARDALGGADLHEAIKAAGGEYRPWPGSILVSITDLQGRITAVNRDFAEASGYAEAELVGRTHAILRHPDMPAAAFADLWSTIAGGRSWRGVVKDRRKDGGHYWTLLHVAPHRHAGVVVGYRSLRLPATREEIAASQTLYDRLRAGREPSLALREGHLVRKGWRGAWDALLRRLDRHGMTAKFSALFAASCAGACLLGWGVAGDRFAAALAAGLLILAATAALRWQLRHLHVRLCTGRRILDSLGEALWRGEIDDAGEDDAARLLLALREAQIRLACAPRSESPGLEAAVASPAPAPARRAPAFTT